MVKATGIGGYGRPAGARNATAIDLEAASQFFRLLGAKYCTFQTFDDRKPRNPELSRTWYGSLSDHANKAKTAVEGYGRPAAALRMKDVDPTSSPPFRPDLYNFCPSRDSGSV